MTFLEATAIIEQAMTDMGMTDVFGDPIIGLEAMGYIGKYFDEEWEANSLAIETGVISVEMYLETALSMIEQVKRIYARRKVERKLAEIISGNGMPA